VPLALVISGVVIFTALGDDHNEQGVQESKNAQTKVLYVTHEPGKWHKYTPQKEKFLEIAAKNGWKVTVMTGGRYEVEDKMVADADFAKGQDVVVYNICMASCQKLKVPQHIMRQTAEHKVPAFLVHCALHSFWPTYKEGGAGVHPAGAQEKVMAKAELVEKWRAEHGDKPFPAWPNFSGMASTKHGPKEAVQTKQLAKEHPIFEGIPEYKTDPLAELYNNFITAEMSPKTQPLLQGSQTYSIKPKGNNQAGQPEGVHAAQMKTDEAVILWEHPYGGSKVLSLTLGHGMEEWNQPEFQALIANSVNYLADESNWQRSE